MTSPARARRNAVTSFAMYSDTFERVWANAVPAWDREAVA